MPYITEDRRKIYDDLIGELGYALKEPTPSGDLNYAVVLGTRGPAAEHGDGVVDPHDTTSWVGG